MSEQGSEIPSLCTSVVVTGLVVGVPYKASMCARNEIGWSTWGAYSEPMMITKPPAPGPPSVEVVDASSLRVSWDAAKNQPGAVSYAVQVNDGKNILVYDHESGGLLQQGS